MPTKFSGFTQRITVNAPSQTIYDILMDSRKHAKLTGSAATVSRKVGGAFEVYDGYAFGTNVELVEGRRIVQTWRALEDEWPEDHFSEVVFDLTPVSKTKTAIDFAHKRVPTSLVKSFKDGWRQYYWDPLKAMFP
ncbi:MAG: SRPBCC domain-containing protein [Flavobacteriales bacterium]